MTFRGDLKKVESYIIKKQLCVQKLCLLYAYLLRTVFGISNHMVLQKRNTYTAHNNTVITINTSLRKLVNKRLMETFHCKNKQYARYTKYKKKMKVTVECIMQKNVYHSFLESPRQQSRRE